MIMSKKAKAALAAEKYQRLNGPLFQFVAENRYSDPEDRQQPVGGRGHTHEAKATEKVTVIKVDGIMNYLTRVEREVKPVSTYTIHPVSVDNTIPAKWNATTTRKGKVK